MKYPGLVIAAALTACAHPAPSRSSASADLVSAFRPIVVIQKVAPAVVPQKTVNADLADARVHLAESDRYVAWDKSKPHIVDRLTPLANAVATAAKKVRADNIHHRVSVADDAELRIATAALKSYIDNKGD